jgi:hypothetical protein
MYNSGFREEAALNIEGFPFRQTFQIASSRLVSLGPWNAIHTSGSGRQVEVKALLEEREEWTELYSGASSPPPPLNPTVQSSTCPTIPVATPLPTCWREASV